MFHPKRIFSIGRMPLRWVHGIATLGDDAFVEFAAEAFVLPPQGVPERERVAVAAQAGYFIGAAGMAVEVQWGKPQLQEVIARGVGQRMVGNVQHDEAAFAEVVPSLQAFAVGPLALRSE